MIPRFHSFDSFLNEQILNEIGEGVSTFDWKRTGNNKVGTWMSDMSQHERGSSTQVNNLPMLTYEFKSDKATYIVKIVGQFKEHSYINFGQKMSTKPHDYDLWIAASFDVVGSEKEIITNFGEQFRVISTVSEIVQAVMKEIQQIKWVKVQEIHLMPKLEDSDEGKPITQTKRGRIYLEYIKKQGKKLEGKWTAEIQKDRFVLKSGTWRSSSGNLIPLSET